MRSMTTRIRHRIRTGFPVMARYAGAGGRAVFVGALERAPSIADFLCGADTKATGSARIRRTRVPDVGLAEAAGGAVSVLFPTPGEPDFPDSGGRAVGAPLRVVLRKSLPDSEEALMEGLKTSTTKEDLRRIRKAGFSFRVTTDPDEIRTFHARHYTPLVRQRFPDDGTILTLERMLEGLDRGGELVCAEIDGDWVAGLFNWAGAELYEMGPLGILDADEAVRQKRVVSGLLVRSMQRALELGLPEATLGFSLPFLGKGPIWFKAKWGCSLEVEARGRRMQLYLDLRHAAVRQVLADSPLVHHGPDGLAVAAWLEPGEAPLKALVREAGRYPGVTAWHVLGEAATLDAARDAFADNDLVDPIAVDPASAEPLWLGRLLPPLLPPSKPV